MAYIPVLFENILQESGNETMSLTFYFAPMSTASVTEAVLAELDVACERIELEIGANGTRRPEFLAINPNGRVPTILHEGVAIWESAAITMYLGETFGMSAGLYPPTGPKRGEAMKWIVWTNMVLAEAGGRLATTLDGDGAAQPGSPDWVPPEQRDDRVSGKAKQDIADALGILEATLANREFLLDRYSLADTHLQTFVGWLELMGIDLSPYPHITAWLARCVARPALAKTVSE
jgi:glutathione S-transferase